MIAKLRTSGMEAAPTTQAGLDRIVRRYIAQWQSVIRTASIKQDD